MPTLSKEKQAASTRKRLATIAAKKARKTARKKPAKKTNKQYVKLDPEYPAIFKSEPQANGKRKYTKNGSNGTKKSNLARLFQVIADVLYE